MGNICRLIVCLGTEIHGQNNCGNLDKSLTITHYEKSSISFVGSHF